MQRGRIFSTYVFSLPVTLTLAPNISIAFTCLLEQVKNKRSHVAGELVVDRVGAFIAEESKRKQEMLTKYGDANFERPFNTKEKLANFVLNNKDRGEKMLNKSAMKTMEKIALDASDKKQADYFARLSNAKWLLSLVVKMREYTKRGASLCPSSCYKMLYSVKSIIAYGFELTPDVFYSIVQNTITEPAKADHSKVIVHKAGFYYYYYYYYYFYCSSYPLTYINVVAMNSQGV